MNIDRLTQKSVAAIQGAQGLAQEYGNQQMEQLHLWRRSAATTRA